MKAADTSGINWNDYFEYDENTPSCLKWKIHLGNTKNRKHAGTLDSRGYFRVSVNKSRYWVHRVVYEMFNGHLTSDMEVDHLDGNKSNNRITIYRRRQGREIRETDLYEKITHLV